MDDAIEIGRHQYVGSKVSGNVTVRGGQQTTDLLTFSQLAEVVGQYLGESTIKSRSEFIRDEPAVGVGWALLQQS